MKKTIDRTPVPTYSPSVEDLFDRYHTMVYRLAFVRIKSTSDADDILQEVFIRYLRFSPVFRDEEHCKAWLLRTTLNCTNSFLGSAWMRRTAPLDETLPTELQEPDSVYPHVMRLSQKYRTVIHLYYYEGYTTAEIAQLLRQKESTVRSHLHRARAILRENLKGAYEDV